MKSIYLIFLALAALTLGGCNSDIFIDDSGFEEVEDLTIEGDGGEATVKMPTKNLVHFGFDLMSSSMQYCQYYNEKGDIIESNSPAKEVSRIVFQTTHSKLELLKSGSRFTIHSVCHASKYPTHWSIRFEYDYGPRFIELEVLPGAPIRLVEVIYNDDMITNDRAKVTTMRESFTNDGPLPQLYKIRPYLNELASILVEPERYESWTKGETFTMPVPVYVNGEWEIRPKEGIRPGDKFTYEGPNRMTEVTLNVAADSKVSVQTDVVYSEAKVKGQMVFHNDVLDITFFENIKVTSYYPTGHEIKINEAK